MYYEGLTTRKIDAESGESKIVSDALGRVHRTVDPTGYYVQRDYDAFGAVVRLRDSAGIVLTSVVYDYGMGAYRTIVDDKDLGVWTYEPNALGEETSYSDAKEQLFSATFDKLGRPLTRVEPEGVTTWVWGTSANDNNIGRLAAVYSPDNTQSFIYDSYGRVEQHRTLAEGTYDINFGYDGDTGLLSFIRYPEIDGSYRFEVTREYQHGILKRVKDSGQTVFWEALAEDPFGNVIDSTLGNGVRTIRGYDAVNGRLDFIESGVGGGGSLQDLSYTWNAVGSLAGREDHNRTLNEIFFYDAQQRLDYSKLNGNTNLDLSYDAIGNISTKSDVSSSAWNYHATKVHAVVEAGTKTYSYDENGNMTSRNGDDIVWNSANYPISIEDGSRTYEYAYDAFRQRWKQVVKNGAAEETTYTIGGIYEKNVHATDTEHRHYIHGRGGVVAMYVRRENSSNFYRYILKDHQGSVSGLLTSSGVAVPHESFTAFGERRDPVDWQGSPSGSDLSQIAGTTDRGFTGHDNLEESSLIHMNGRVMDAHIGRFLSPDPHIPDPNRTQAYNPYGYVYNNPLSYTDPSGFIPCAGPQASICVDVFASIVGFIFGMNDDNKPPPNFCFIGGPIGCSGTATSTTKTVANDVSSLPIKRLLDIYLCTRVMRSPLACLSGGTFGGAGGTSAGIPGEDWDGITLNIQPDASYQSRKEAGHAFYVLEGRLEAVLDRFNKAGQSAHEFHIYRSGKEIGLYSNGQFIAKHGFDGRIPNGMTANALQRLHGLDIEVRRRARVLPEKGRANIKGLFKNIGRALGLVALTVPAYEIYRRPEDTVSVISEFFGVTELSDGLLYPIPDGPQY